MNARVSDHDLHVLVESAAQGMWDAKASHQGGPAFVELPHGVRNNIREAALPFVFHGTKALSDLGYSKPRLITAAEELDALQVGSAVKDEDGHVHLKYPRGWVRTGQEPFSTPEGILPGYVIHEATK